MSEFEIERQGLYASSRDQASRVAVPASRPLSDTAAGMALPAERLDSAIAQFDAEEKPPAAREQAPEQSQVIALLMKNANLLIENKETRLALNILRSVLMREPNHPEALEKMGTHLRESGQIEEALKCFRALSRVKREARSMALLAETLYLMERDEQALNVYRDVLRSVVSDEPKLFEIFKNVGNIHVRAGDFDAAEEFYNKAYTLCPDSDTLMVNYGTLEIQRENLEAAVARFRRAVELNPENDRGWVGLAILHRQMGDMELAAANIARALDINSTNRTALRLAVDWGAQDHNLSPLISRLQDYLAVNGEDAEISFTLAKVLVHMGRLREARIEMERALALDPGIEGGDSLRTVLDRELSQAGRAG